VPSARRNLRRAGEKIAHGDGGSCRTAGFPDVLERSAIHANGYPRERCGFPSHHFEAADRRNARQRLPAETKGTNGLEILDGLDLAGGMPFQRQEGIVG